MSAFRFYVPLVLCLALMSSCTRTRPISDAGYRESYGGTGNRLYRGEITELDVLGTSGPVPAVEGYAPVTIKRGDRLLVINLAPCCRTSRW